MKQLFSKDNRSDIIVGIIVLTCLFLSSNIIPGFMPSELAMLFIGIFIAAFGLFAVFIWHESPRDEREAHILLSSDRLGFLVGAILLSILLVIQSIKHEPTELLAAVLSAMILAKLIGKYVHK
jgi:hypothetical protein